MEKKDYVCAFVVPGIALFHQVVAFALTVPLLYIMMEKKVMQQE